MFFYGDTGITPAMMHAAAPALGSQYFIADSGRQGANRLDGSEKLQGARCGRKWMLEQKREIVAESFGPELTATEVARKHGISSGQRYTWRQQC